MLTEQMEVIRNKLYEGCYQDSTASRDLPFHVASDGGHMTVDVCMKSCREQSFRFAGIQVNL